MARFGPCRWKKRNELLMTLSFSPARWEARKGGPDEKCLEHLQEKGKGSIARGGRGPDVLNYLVRLPDVLQHTSPDLLPFCQLGDPVNQSQDILRPGSQQIVEEYHVHGRLPDQWRFTADVIICPRELFE